MKAATKRPQGRQSTYTPDIGERVCALIAQGKTLRQIEELDGMPPKETVNGWAIDDVDGFAARYARAQRIRTYGMRDEIVDISDDETLEPDDKRVRIDARKWVMAKTLPKEFGDRIQHEHSGGVIAGTIVIGAATAPKVIEGRADVPDMLPKSGIDDDAAS